MALCLTLKGKFSVVTFKILTYMSDNDTEDFILSCTFSDHRRNFYNFLLGNNRVVIHTSAYFHKTEMCLTLRMPVILDVQV